MGGKGIADQLLPGRRTWAICGRPKGFVAVGSQITLCTHLAYAVRHFGLLFSGCSCARLPNGEV